MRSRVTCRASGRRAARFLLQSHGRFRQRLRRAVSGILFRAGLSARALRIARSAPPTAFRSCAHAALREARGSSPHTCSSRKTRGPVALPDRARSSSGCPRLSAAISGSSGKTQVNWNSTRLQENVLNETEKHSARGAATFATRGRTQIYAAQQRGELLRRHFYAPRGRLGGGNRVCAFFEALRPDRKAVPMSSRSRESHPEPLTEPCLNLSIYTALVAQP